ncbi:MULTISPECIES: PrgI family protein [Amycolatopsis]|uniref:PrgI family protein n=1 Tax=Amycolatopsis dongchuanensis TaxID=1070866 RepID=A0ABP9PZS1_9PSEU
MTHPVRIPSDVDRDDHILANFTARQVAVLAVAGLVLYGGWLVTKSFLPTVAYLVVAVPVGIAVIAVVVLQRDGLPLDRLLLAAVRQRLSPRRRVTEGPPQAVPEWLADAAGETAQVATGGLDLPATGIGETGIVDLGSDGVALIAVCSTVNFALRTPAEQEALVAAFARYLDSLAAPVQVLVRAARLDLSEQIDNLEQRAPTLPHPALEQAARDHARFLSQLGEQADLLRRQILLVVREPLQVEAMTRPRRKRAAISDAARRSAAQRLVRRVNEATELLSGAGVAVTLLDAGQATAVLAAACDPDRLLNPTAGLAGADDVITTAPDLTWEPEGG